MKRTMFPLAHIGLPFLPFLAAGRIPRWAPLIVLGGLLPDILDKPLGHLLLPENNGRIFAHTLVFAVIAVCIGLAYSKALPVAYGILFHHLLDNVYVEPQPTLWPFLGPFEHTDFTYALWFEHLLDPLVLGGEILGAALLLWLVYRYFKIKRGSSKTIYN